MAKFNRLLGSFVACAAMLGGISTPASAADIRLNAGLENNYQDGELNYQIALKGGKTDVAVALCDKDGKQIASATGAQGVIKVPKVKAWTAETPYLYKVYITLKNKQGVAEVIPQNVGSGR